MEVHGQLLESRADPSARRTARPPRAAGRRSSRRACSLSLCGMTGSIPCSFNQSRTRAVRLVAREPLGRGDHRRRVLSCTCPAVTSTASGTPAPSVTRWNFDPNPPRPRPSAWSRGSSGCRSRLFCQPRPRRGSRARARRPRTTGPSDARRGASAATLDKAARKVVVHRRTVRAGRARGAGVQEKMPLSIRRGARRPTGPSPAAPCGSTSAHCSSAWRLMREDVKRLTEVYHHVPAFSDRA